MKDDFKGFYSHYQSYKKWCKAVLTLAIFFLMPIDLDCYVGHKLFTVLHYNLVLHFKSPEGHNAILSFYHDFF